MSTLRTPHIVAAERSAQRRSALMWLGVWLGLLLAGEGLGFLLAAQGWPAAGETMRWVGRSFAGAWLVNGLYRGRHIPAVRRATVVIVATALAGVLALLLLSLSVTAGVIAVIGIYAMAMGFFLGLRVIRLFLSPGHPVLGVARTLVDEAIRMRLALVFVVALLLIVPVLPWALDPSELLKYRIQSFLTWSMMAVSMLLSVMTIFLAVGTICNEMSQRQIFLTMTKPVRRVHYLAGKWLGIVLLDLLLVAVAGGGIYAFTKVLEHQPAKDGDDRAAVARQVLVAREAISPRPPGEVDFQSIFNERLAKLRAEDPQQYGQPEDPASDIKPAARRQIQQLIIIDWYSLAPRSIGSYQFNGLAEAKTLETTVQLRIKPKAASETSDGFVYLNMRVNGRPFSLPPLADDNYHVIEIPSESVDENGALKIDLINAIANGREQPTITFNAQDGIQLFYRVGHFEGNLVRSLALLWIRLCFLGVLGLMAGTYLSFPVASLLALLIYVAAACSGYLQESFEFYSAFPKASLSTFDKIVWVPTEIGSLLFDQGKPWDAIKIVIRLIGSGFMYLVPSFSNYNGTVPLADGRLVPYQTVTQALLWVGLIWSGTAALLGWLIFRKRELARVTV